MTRSLWLGIALLAGLAVALWWAFDAPAPVAPPTPAAAPSSAVERPATQTLEGVVLEGVDERGGRWVLHAERAAADEQASLANLEDVRFTHQMEQGAVEATAARCRADEVSGVELAGDVDIRWGQWRALSDEVRYDRETRRITSTSPVRILGRGLAVSGVGLEVDVEAETAVILRDARAVWGENQP